jgi:hypothetical protein
VSEMPSGEPSANHDREVGPVPQLRLGSSQPRVAEQRHPHVNSFGEPCALKARLDDADDRCGRAVHRNGQTDDVVAALQRLPPETMADDRAEA